MEIIETIVKMLRVGPLTSAVIFCEKETQVCFVPTKHANGEKNTSLD